MIRLSEIDALQAEKMQLAKAEAMEEAAAFAGGVTDNRVAPEQTGPLVCLHVRWWMAAVPFAV